MGWFSSLFKGIGSVASNLVSAVPVVGPAISDGINSLIDSSNQADARKFASNINNQNVAAQQQMNERNIAFQREANQANIASQEKINQSQIDFQKQVNDLMRRDSRNAISDKRADLARAGYSAADPSLQGFSPASLGSPNLSAPVVEAPHVESEFDPQAIIGGLSSYSSSLQSLASLKLSEAQTRAVAAQAKGSEIDNIFKEVEHLLGQQKIGEEIKNLVETGKLTSNQAKKVIKEIDVANKQLELFAEQVTQAKFVSEHQKEVYDKTMQEAQSRINELDAKSADLGVQKSIHEIDKEIRAIQKFQMKFGISPDSSDFLNTILRIIHSSEGAPLLHSVFDYLGMYLEIARGKRRYNPETGNWDSYDTRQEMFESELPH